MGVSCKNCGGTELDSDHGTSVCVGCGSVVESLCIVNDIEFQENSAGNSTVIGQFVSADGGQHYGMGSGYMKHGSRDHRQSILDKGRHLINNYGSQIKMSHHCLDSAFMFYKMAINKRFTVGRKTIYVIGACLYLVSRTEKTPHMLLDIADVIQCDIVLLGRVYLLLGRELCIDCPIIDPSLYIHRFSHQLDFGGKTNEVAMAALRILARMKKDWIHLGRRPSALCGAALIIAAKLHHFHVSTKNIVKVVRMSKHAVFNRLLDFSRTATGKLTTDEFKTVDLEEEADPPCYTMARNQSKFAQDLEGQAKFLASDVLSQVVKTQEQLEVLLDKRRKIDKEMEKLVGDAKMFNYQKELPADYSLYQYELDESGEFKIPKHVIDKDDVRGNYSTASSTLLTDTSVKKSEETTENKTEVLDDDEEIDLDGINDDEIDRMLLTENEIIIKTEIWLEENKDYLLKMKVKEEEMKQKEEEEGREGFKKKKKYAKRKNKDRPVAGSADEAIQTMLAEKKFSSKINYDVLRGLKKETNEESVVKKETVEALKPTIIYESGPLKRAKKRTVVNLAAVKRVKPTEDPIANKPDVGQEREIPEIMINDEINNEDDNDRKNEEDNVVSTAQLFAKEVDDYDEDFDDYDEDEDAFY